MQNSPIGSTNTVECLSSVEALHQICNARSIAVVGASSVPSKYGYSLVETLLKGDYNGDLYLVNPKAEWIQGLRAYPSIRAIPGKLDLVLIIIPAEQIPRALEEAAEKGARVAVIYSAGYRELGHPEREVELSQCSRRHGIRFLGPNIQGFIYVPNRLSAMFWPAVHIESPLAIISQSGSVSAGLTEWAVRDGLGISANINLGNQVDLCDADALEYLGRDEHTKAILLYLEGVIDGPRFMETVRKVSRHKGIVLLKSGRTQYGRKSAASHTGALAGNDEVFSAACRQFGAVRADDMESLYDIAKAMAVIQKPRGRRVCIVSSSGGGNTLAADEAERQGLILPALPPELVERLNQLDLLPNAHLSNPMDLGSVTETHFEKAVEAADQFDLADFYVLAFCDPVPGATEMVRRLASKIKAQLVVFYFGGGELEIAARVDIQFAGIPVYPAPERAMRGIAGTVWAAEQRQLESDKELVEELI